MRYPSLFQEKSKGLFYVDLTLPWACGTRTCTNAVEGVSAWAKTISMAKNIFINNFNEIPEDCRAPAIRSAYSCLPWMLKHNFRWNKNHDVYVDAKKPTIYVYSTRNFKTLVSKPFEIWNMKWRIFEMKYEILVSKEWCGRCS